jgi:peptidoglycan hydrolase-like protein with peptidoglycan-binding domain
MRQIQAFLVAAVLAALCFSPLAGADELTEIIQKDLVVLGYDPGNISGEMSMETVVAISKFQAENSLEVTGEASPQLAGIIKARISGRSGGAVAAAPAQPDPAALRAAQQAFPVGFVGIGIDGAKPDKHADTRAVCSAKVDALCFAA